MVVLAILITIVSIRSIRSTGSLQEFFLLLTPVMLLGFHYYQKLSVRQRTALLGLILAVIILSDLNIAQIMKSNIAHPPEWDFLGFWLHGKVAAQGLNFYEPIYAQQLAQPFNPTWEFTHEILDVGFWYPPPTIFLFVPLGWVDDIHLAYGLWYVAQSVILILDIFLLWKIFLKKSDSIGLALSAALVLILFGTHSTIEYGQTNFVALLMLLLFWRDRDRHHGGLWLAVGIFTKPFLGGLLIYLLLRRHWHTLASTIVALSAISLLTISIFGPVTFFSYFKASHYAKLPDWVYTEMTNQSLLATILRLTKYDFSHTSPLMQPIFIALALLMTGITGWIIYCLDARHDDWALVLMLLLTLLLYPVSQMFYSVLLILPILLLWAYRQKVPGSIWSVVPLITLMYAIMDYRSGNYIFIANTLNWFIFAGLGFWAIKQQSMQRAI